MSEICFGLKLYGTLASSDVLAFINEHSTGSTKMVAPAVKSIFVIQVGDGYRAPRHDESHDIPSERPQDRQPYGPQTDLQIVPHTPEIDERKRRDEAIIRGGLLDNWDEITNERPTPTGPILH